jgi:hypothetical protein
MEVLHLSSICASGLIPLGPAITETTEESTVSLQRAPGTCDEALVDSENSQNTHAAGGRVLAQQQQNYHHLRNLEQPKKWLRKCWERREKKRRRIRRKGRRQAESPPETVSTEPLISSTSAEPTTKSRVSRKPAPTKAELAEAAAVEAATAAVASLDWAEQEKVVVSWNTILRVGTWNVRSLSSSDRSSGGEQAQRDVMSDVGAKQLALVAVQECRWEEVQLAKPMGAYMWYGGGAWRNPNNQPNGGVLVGVHKRWSRAVIQHAHRGGRVQLVVLRGQKGRRIVFGNVYAPTEAATDVEKDALWRDIAGALEDIKLSSRDVLIMPGDYNGETGRSLLQATAPSDGLAEQMHAPVVGPWGCGAANGNGQRLLEECARRRWFLGESFVARPPRQMWSFRGNFPVGEGVRSHREYDHFVCSTNLAGRIQDVRNVWGTRHESDHCLRVMELKLGGKEFVPAKQMEPVAKALRRVDVAEAVGTALRKVMPGAGEAHRSDQTDEPEFDGVIVAAEDMDLKSSWDTFKKVAYDAAMGLKPTSEIQYQGMTEKTLALIKQRAQLRVQMGNRTYTADQSKKGRALRKLISRAVRKDKTAHLTLLAARVQQAVGAGNMRQAHKAVKTVSGKGQGGAANIQTMDMGVFSGFYEKLLGQSSQDVPPHVKQQRTWVIAEELLADKSKYAPLWDALTGAPSLEEFEAMVKKAPNEKGVSQDQITVELIKNNSQARVIVWKLVVKVWDLMAASKPGEKLDIPDDFVQATLVCLYKGKGDKEDPAKYRGISLISIVERFMSSLLLGRIGSHADKHMKQQQAGFRPLKSCRDAVSRLWRDIEKMRDGKIPCIYTFVDFSKAFDSLLWARMWDILEFSGCPPQLVAVIRSLHEHAMIALRLNSDGDLAAAFAQMKGIRQGSGLSPCLFVLVLDFVMRVYEEGCAEEGLDRVGTWNAYADDVVDKTAVNENESAAQLEINASTTMQLLEGAAAFTGLLVNVPKTEAMGCGTQRPGTNLKQAWRERAKLSFPGAGMMGHRTLVSFHGWIADAKWSGHLGISGSIHAETLKLQLAFPNATIRVMVVDARDESDDGQPVAAYLPEDGITKAALSDNMIDWRARWLSSLGKSFRDRLEFRMEQAAKKELTVAAAAAASWRALVAAVEADKTGNRAELKQQFQAAVEEDKKMEASSVHNAAPPKTTVSRGKRAVAEAARVTAVEQLLTETHAGKRRVFVLAEMGNSGNARHISGATLQVLRQGFSQCLNGDKFGFIDCPGCNVTMMSAKTLVDHQTASKGVFCLGYQAAEAAVVAGKMTETQLANRRHRRVLSFRRSGKLEKDGAETVKVRTCSGADAATCSSFVYLGSMISPDATSQGEIRRRAVRAWSIMGDLDNIWQSRCITWKLKGQLFSALVLSVMLYNAEVWPLTKDDLILLEGIHTRMTRSICVRATRRQSEKQQKKVVRVKKTDVLKLLQLPTMTLLLRQKRLRWVGHALRRDDSDLSKVELKKELALSSNTWTKCVLSDMKELEIKSVKDLEDKSMNREKFRKISSAYTQI